MHSQHSQAQRMARGKCAKPHKRWSHRYGELPSQRDQFLGAVRVYYSTPDIEDRPGCLAHLLHGKPDLFRVAHNARLITRHAWLLCVSECGHLSADIFGNVYE